jgi:phosphate uptake regulator
MIRKVSKIGPATLMISLPSSWVKKYKVKKGDELIIEEENEKLIVKNNQNSNFGEWIINSKDMNPKIIKRYIIAGYKLGIDKIQFTNTNSDIIRKISPIIVQNILGFEIINKTQDSFTIKSMQTETTLDFNESVKIIFQLLLEMAKECEIILEKNDKINTEHINELESNNNRLTNLLRRIINKKGYVEKEKNVYAYLIVEHLEKTADLYRELIKITKLFPKEKPSEQIINYTKEVNEQLLSFYKLNYINYNTKLIIDFISSKEKTTNQGNKLLYSNKGMQTLLLSVLMQINKKNFEMLAPSFSLKTSLNIKS